MPGQKVNPKIELTQDGSHSLRHHELDELYHSHYGAIQESKHVFIEAGLKQIEAKSVSILEIGFGTGLNALLSAIEAQLTDLSIEYTGIEKYPVGEETWSKLNYPDVLGAEKGIFAKMHQSAWGEFHEVIPGFKLRKLETDFSDFQADEAFDLIYYDAFAPSAQPEFWEGQILENMHRALRPGGILVTYCSKGSFRRALQSAGFEVEKIPGPPGKREMVRASKS